MKRQGFVVDPTPWRGRGPAALAAFRGRDRVRRCDRRAVSNPGAWGALGATGTPHVREPALADDDWVGRPAVARRLGRGWDRHRAS